MRLNLMIEGQEGVSWDEWVSLARAVENNGYEGLFRSDHYSSFSHPDERGSLDAWTTLAGIASITDRIKLGTLVSPVTFRHPSELSKEVVTVSHISNGRAELGLGAGWHDPEHVAHGFVFPDTGVRMEMLAEQLEIVSRQWADEPFDFKGRHYELTGSMPLPKPKAKPNLIMGGGVGPRSVKLAARWADEYNIVYPSVEKAREARATLAKAWEEAGRDPESLVLSVMTGVVVGENEKDFRKRADALMARTNYDGSFDDWYAKAKKNQVAGTVEQAIDRVEELADAGVQRIMLQHLNHVDVEMVVLVGERIAKSVR
ncbi:MAG: hypothetical protein QOK47_1224 [Actinomycetota bacterium]|jgi:alkanesulfonate monooxygenase SsuD/methylene tetrahydromethanopterin reductase-like flavin-dependent oxidoreductase (luciferase family)|nr:hypothetical protein [Actinomycetota bacterium]